MADRGRRSRCFSAPGSQRPPAALSRRVTAADIMCSVVPAGAELRHVELFGNSTAGAPAGSPLAPPLRTQSPLTPHVLSHRRDITPAQAPRDGSAHSCSSTQNYGATSAAARRCPWQQEVPPHHPPAASASLSHATPPPMHTSNATSDPAASGNIRGDEASANLVCGAPTDYLESTAFGAMMSVPPPDFF